MVAPRRVFLPAAMAASLCVSGCASVEPRVAYTGDESVRADVTDLDRVRFYGDGPAFVFERFRREVALQAAARHEPVTVLALSGGGADGAFGAGFLKGLSETRRRPAFTMVTGVSTGALIAPFAFLGSGYDDRLEGVYTNGLAETLVRDASLLNGLFGNALVDSDKLGRLIARNIDQPVLDAVAAEHRRGRRLLVVTTNIDAQRSVVWDMGAIAASGSPKALSLFRQVMAASASIPALFPPRLIEVEAGGRQFQEMHVDGSTLRQFYVAPDAILYGGPASRDTSGLKDVFVIVNGKLDPSFQVVDNGTVPVAARALSTLLRRESRNDANGAYAYAVGHGVGYHLAYIAPDVPELATEDANEQFSTAYMRTLFARGEAQGRSAAPWASRPPLDPDPATGGRPERISAAR